MKDSDVTELSKRLDLIANLLTMLAADRESPASITSRVLVLKESGLGPAEIGRVLGKSTNYVGSILSQKKSKAMKKEKGKARACDGTRKTTAGSDSET